MALTAALSRLRSESWRFLFSYLSHTGPCSQEDFASSTPSFLGSEASSGASESPRGGGGFSSMEGKVKAAAGWGRGRQNSPHGCCFTSRSACHRAVQIRISTSRATPLPPPRHSCDTPFGAGLQSWALGTRDVHPQLCRTTPPPAQRAGPGLARGSLAPWLPIRTRARKGVRSPQLRLPG